MPSKKAIVTQRKTPHGTMEVGYAELGDQSFRVTTEIRGEVLYVFDEDIILIEDEKRKYLLNVQTGATTAFNDRGWATLTPAGLLIWLLADDPGLAKLLRKDDFFELAIWQE